MSNLSLWNAKHYGFWDAYPLGITIHIDPNIINQLIKLNLSNNPHINKNRHIIIIIIIIT